jgi:WD40 repeat protein
MSGSDDSTCKVFDLNKSGVIVSSFVAHRDRMVYSLAISQDETKAITCSWDSTVRIFTFPTNCVELAVLEGHSGVIMSVDVDSKFLRAISGSWDNTCRVWNLNDFTCERVLNAHEADCNAVAISPDGHRAVTASDDKNCHMWCLDTGEKLATFTGHTEMIVSVSLKISSETSFLIATGSWDGTIRLFDSNNSTNGTVVTTHDKKVACVKFNPSGSLLATGSFDATSQIIDLYYDDRLRIVALIASTKLPQDITTSVRKMLIP